MTLNHPLYALSRPRIRLVALVLIVGLGWLLRTHALETRSLWADEGWTMLLSSGPSLSEITQTLAADQHPPLFFMLFRLWRSVTGDSEFATRYFSVLSAVLAIALIYQLGRSLYGVRTGVLAALILALFDLHIDLAQEVRHYSLLATLAIASSVFYARWWQNPTRTNRIGYVLSSILLLYTHYLGGYVLIAHLIHMLLVVRPPRRLLNALFLFGAVCAAFAPWFLVVLEQNRVRWDNPLYYQNALPNNLTTYRMVRTALLGQHYVLFGLLVLLGLVYVLYRPGQTRIARITLRPLWPTLFALVWIVFMAGLTVIINAQREFLTVRNFIVVVPALAVLVAHGLRNLPALARGFTVILILVIGLTTVDARRSYPDWRNVTNNITPYHLDGEPILMDIWVGDFAVRYYIDRQIGKDTPRVSLREWRDDYREFFLPTLLDYLQRQDSFWLVYWGDDPIAYRDIIAKAGFQRTATLRVDHQGTPLYSYRYDRLAGEPRARFGDLFVLQDAHAPDDIAPGETIRVMLWWAAGQTPSLDYSVSVFVRNSTGWTIAQHDGPPLDGQAPTSTWQPKALQFDVHYLTLPEDLPAGDYHLGVKVYWYGDGQPLPVAVPGKFGVGEYFELRSWTIE